MPRINRNWTDKFILCFRREVIDGLANNFETTDDGQLLFIIGGEGFPGNTLGERENFLRVDRMSPRRASCSAGSIKLSGVGKDQLFPHRVRILFQGLALDEIDFASEQPLQLLFEIIYKGKVRHSLGRAGRERYQQVQIAFRVFFTSGNGTENFQPGDRASAAEILQCRFEPAQGGGR